MQVSNLGALFWSSPKFGRPEQKNAQGTQRTETRGLPGRVLLCALRKKKTGHPEHFRVPLSQKPPVLTQIELRLSGNHNLIHGVRLLDQNARILG